jgi:ABC-type multidrug transport system fused ATPase/permease subunit
MEYAKPGDSLNYRIPVIVDVENKKTIYPKSTALFKSQYQVTAPQWDENGKTLTFEFNERGHKTYRVLEMDLTGNVRTLIEEKNDKYVAYSRNFRQDLDADHILWKSDRDGHAHLYLYHRKSRKLAQVTKGDYWVRGVQHAEIDEKGNITETDRHTGRWAWKHPHKADGTVTYTEVKGEVQLDNVVFGYEPEKIVLNGRSRYAKQGQKNFL